ncbi:MAG TPA: amidohydrolase family protein [Xanthobacteraceae bacterium]|nr:amidohydrolase family protein [Xanthobacteraceae bacterium]
MPQRTIDTHAHILTDETMRFIAKEAPKLAPVLQDPKADVTTLVVGDVPYQPFPRGGWNIEKRLQDMDATLVDVQLITATPQTYYYDQEASVGVALSALQNEQLAKHVKDHPDRFMGLATLPMQAPDKAAQELRRAITQLGLRGAMIGSNCEGKNLDDPSFEPLWQTAQELDAFIFIHPVSVAGANRLKDYYLRNFIGNPLDTTIAAACLVFGGCWKNIPSSPSYSRTAAASCPTRWDAGCTAGRSANPSRRQS